MAISYEQRQEVIALLVGMFDAAPNATILSEFVTGLEGGATVSDYANSLDDHELFLDMYPNWLTDSEFAEAFAASLLDGSVSADAEAAAVVEIEALLALGLSRGDTINAAVDFLMNDGAVGTDWEDAGILLQNKVTVATEFAVSMLDADSDMETLKSVIASVDETEDSVTDQLALLDIGVITEDDFDFVMSVNQDSIEGTAGDDTIVAWAFDNQNTAQSGDMIDGGAGTDTLYAEIGNSQQFAISLKTENLEIAMFEAMSGDVNDTSDNDINREGVDGDGIRGGAQVDAGDMGTDTEEYWSVDSRANLQIEDVQRNSHETTIGWRNADAGAVNFEVYFDNITAPGAETTASNLYLELLDLDGMRTDGEPLLDNPYVGFSFTRMEDGVAVQYDLAAPDPVQTTYADLVLGINALLAEQGLDTVSAAEGDTFTAFNSKDGLEYEGTTIVLTDTSGAELAGLGWIVDGFLPPDSNVHTQIETTDSTPINQLTQTNVIFDYVGSGSMAHDFVAGEISQGNYSGSAGIQQFNIDVDRDSWVNEVRSTHNWLEEVYVDSIGAEGTLRIDELHDVRVFDATSMTNDVTLTAEIGMQDHYTGRGLFEKYVDLVDDDANYEADNVEFNYLTSGADDSLNLTVAQEAASYEDFEMLVSTGSGNDRVWLEVNDSDGTLDVNWRADQAALDNITVSTGAGDDVVTTFGGGEATISVASGNDTVYSDNSGIDNQMATWIFNAANTDLNDIRGNGNGTNYYLEGGRVAVTFSGSATNGGVSSGNAVADTVDELGASIDAGNGFTAWADIATTNGVADAGDISQAIKDAINNDSVLSKLIIAEDGPNHSLIVTSLIDGVFDAQDLDVIITEGIFADENTSTNQEDYNDFVADSTDDFDATEYADNAAAAAAAYTGADYDDLYGDSTGGASVDNQVLGQEGVFGEYTIDLTTANYAAAEVVAIDIDGGGDDFISAAVTGGETPAQLAALLLANGGGGAGLPAGYSVTDNGDGTITVTQTAYAAAAIALGAADTGTTALAINTVTAAVALTDQVGVASDEETNDNVINLGTGNDVAVLSTNDGTAEDATGSNEAIVLTDTAAGINTIVNFTAGAGAGADTIVLTAWLTDLISASGSTESQVLAAKDEILTNGVATTHTVDANSITVIDDFVQDIAGGATETWANLTAALFEAAIEDTAGTGATDFGNIVDATVDTAAATANLVGSTRSHIFLVENDLNDGEYKVFYNTDNNTATDTFSGTVLLGIYDFGEEVGGGAGFDTANFTV